MGGIDHLGGHRRGHPSNADEFDTSPYESGLGPQGRNGYVRPPHASSYHGRSQVSSVGDVSSTTSRNSSPLSARFVFKCGSQRWIGGNCFHTFDNLAIISTESVVCY